MNPNPDLLLNPPLNPLVNSLISTLPELPVNNLGSFHSLLSSASSNHVINHPFPAVNNPWDDQLYANYPANQLPNQPCMSSSSPNYSANYSANHSTNHSATSANSPPNYNANYVANPSTNHSTNNMVNQINHNYEQLISLCTSSATGSQHANHSANYANVGFDYIPNYDHLVTNHYANHEGAVISEDIKESLSRANSSSLITLPKPHGSEVIHKQELMTNQPNSTLITAPPNSEAMDPNQKLRKKRSRSEVNSDSLKEEIHEQSTSSSRAIPKQKRRRADAAGAGKKSSVSAAIWAAGPACAVDEAGSGSVGTADGSPDHNSRDSTSSDALRLLNPTAAVEVKSEAYVGPADVAKPLQPSDRSAKCLTADGGDKPTRPPAEPSPAAGSGPAQLDYIHVRARRGQATDSHSLAERVRREKIGERMKYLQDLVPGCSKVTGKAMMLDEIINYVQSLQRQVEFLSMKLASMHPNKVESLFKEAMQPVNHVQSTGQIGGPYNNSFHTLPLQPVQPVNQVINTSCAPTISDHTFGSECISQINGRWDDVDIQSVMQMGFAQNPLLLNGAIYHGHLKKEL